MARKSLSKRPKPSPAGRRFSGAAGNLFKVNLITALFWTHFISSVLVPFYRDWGGLTLGQILLVNAWFMIWNFLLEVPTGTVADVWGRKASIVLSGAVGVVAVLVYVSAPSLPRFLLAEILFATSFTLLSGANEALLYDSLKELGREEEAAQRFAWLSSSQLSGIVVGALFGSVIANEFGLRAPLLFQAIPIGLSAVLALSLYEPREGRPTERPGYREVLTVGMRYFFTHPGLRILALDMVVFGGIAWALIWLYQAALERAGVPLLWFGVIHVGLSLGQIVFLAQLERFRSALGSWKALLTVGPLAMVLGYAALAWRDAPAWLVIGAVVLTASLGLSRPPLFSAHFNRRIDSARRATVLSTINMVRTLVVAFTNVVVGLLADVDLSWAMAGLSAMALLALLFSPLRERHLADPVGEEVETVGS
jgi:MFS family permease